MRNLQRSPLLAALLMLPVIAGVLLLAPTSRAAAAAREAARDELRGYLEDITGASLARYGVRDDLGRPMQPGSIIARPGGGYAAVYFVWADDGRTPSVELATSPDLVEWRWRTRLAYSASQPTIEPGEDGGFVVGWEKEPPNHVQFAWYPTWRALVRAEPDKLLDAPMTLSPCAEGTPSLYRASSTHLDVGLHYYDGCRIDRLARARTDWQRWTAKPAVEREAAVRRYGVKAGVGDRDTINFRGFNFTLQEGMTIEDRWDTWRIYLHDEATGTAAPLDLRTPAGCVGFANPSVELATYDGLPAIIASMFVTAEGGRACEAGTLIYARTLDAPIRPS
ncbi:MAG: hypothetical protein FIA92_10375 [Chloroflexi bacterium]|nr:hypothetical protein [Chloroflexota bacterium]